jgi:hypothetical protein
MPDASSNSQTPPFVRFNNEKYLTLNGSGQVCLFDKYSNLLFNLESGGTFNVTVATATILAGQNGVVYAHGLGRTPTVVETSQTDPGTYHYAYADATNVYIYLGGGSIALADIVFTLHLI